MSLDTPGAFISFILFLSINYRNKKLDDYTDCSSNNEN